MRVLCINENWVTPEAYKTPCFMEECEVVDTRTVGHGQYLGDEMIIPGVYYKLSSYGPYLFHADNFATLPDQTAEEMSEENRESIVNIETVLI